MSKFRWQDCCLAIIGLCRLSPFCPWFRLAIPRQTKLDLMEFHDKRYGRVYGQHNHGNQ